MVCNRQDATIFNNGTHWSSAEVVCGQHFSIDHDQGLCSALQDIQKKGCNKLVMAPIDHSMGNDKKSTR